jgi:hypothetical protein
MLFVPETAGRWVATNNGKVVDSAKDLFRLMDKIEKRSDRRQLRFDLIPPARIFIGRMHAL